MAPTTATTFAAGTGKRRFHHHIFGHAHQARRGEAIDTTTLAESNPLFTYPTSTLPTQSASTPNAKITGSGTTAQIPTGSPTTFPREKLTGNVIAAVVVAVVVMGSILGVVVAGEILKRRNRRRRGVGGGSSKGGTDEMQEKGKEILNRNSLDSPASSSIKGPTHHLEHATGSPVQRTVGPFWIAQIFQKAHGGFHRKNAESPKETLPSRTPAEQSKELPQRTTWSDFSYAPGSLGFPRPLLHCIHEECEDDCQSQSGSEIALVLGLALQRSLDSVAFTSSVHRASQARSFTSLRFSKTAEASTIVEKAYKEDRDDVEKVSIPASVLTAIPSTKEISCSEMVDTDSELAPAVSLQTVGTGASAERESLREEIFELRRVQTRSMQMDKGVLVSLGVEGEKDEEDVDDEPSDTETEHARSFSTMTTPSSVELFPPAGCEASLRPGCRDILGSQMTLATLASSYSAVDLDDFPLPPSNLELCSAH